MAADQRAKPKPASASSGDGGRAPSPRPLTILPSGDAVRAAEVRAIRIVKEDALPAIERPLYSVLAYVESGDPIELVARVAYVEAKQVARSAAQTINKALSEK